MWYFCPGIMRNCSNLTRMFNSAVTCRLVVQRVGVLLLLLLLLCQVFNYWRTVHINGGAASFKNTVRAQKRAARIRMRHQPRTGLCSRTGAQHGAWSRRCWLSWAELLSSPAVCYFDDLPCSGRQKNQQTYISVYVCGSYLWHFCGIWFTGITVSANKVLQ